jgi:hypothetical protein
MTQIILDAATLSKLNNLREPAELCDETGKVRAQLFPVFDPSEWEPVGPDLSDEEIERRLQEPDYSTAEVLAYLESL